MAIKFNDLIFEIKDDRVLLNDRTFAEIQICGENKPTHLGAKMTNSSEGGRLKYVSHTQSDNTLEIVQRSDLVRVKTVFSAYDNTNAVRVHTEVENVSNERVSTPPVTSRYLTLIRV